MDIAVWTFGIAIALGLIYTSGAGLLFGAAFAIFYRGRRPAATILKAALATGVLLTAAYLAYAWRYPASVPVVDAVTGYFAAVFLGFTLPFFLWSFLVYKVCGGAVVAARRLARRRSAAIVLDDGPE